ncbi:CotJB protein [uncultured Roseburia sp.]|uniref:Spore coat protein CotJB n=1 Tax=Brotonthovivens ammoniilytica TaxID=2981725 RepID=A0ABT2TH28_9FIRM|nr:spore coat protein CotJB [Brotonthovivens ammoniilytica]MCU6761498.1 spore coat protein CotJB [Brotonthovivens ammoniilytica]SCI30169.1 CotJB protein [uncultured Roseburia sp.]
MNAERKKLFDYINQVSFSINDLTLYLDTHPDDAEALEYMKELIPCRKKALKEYQEKYMPLLVDGTSEHADIWKWSTTAWPWERGYY